MLILLWLIVSNKTYIASPFSITNVCVLSSMPSGSLYPCAAFISVILYVPGVNNADILPVESVVNTLVYSISSIVS